MDERRAEAVRTAQPFHRRPVTAGDEIEAVAPPHHVDGRRGRRRSLFAPAGRPRHLPAPAGRPRHLPAPAGRPRRLSAHAGSPRHLPTPAGRPRRLHASAGRPRCLHAPAGGPRRQRSHIGRVGLRVHRHVIVRRAALASRLEHAPRLQRQQHCLQPAAAAPGGEAEVDGHAGGMDRPIGGVAGLMGQRPGQARDHQPLAAGPAVLRRQPLDEEPHLGAGERERHVDEGVVPVPREVHEEAGVDEPAHLRGARQVREVVPPGLGDLTIERRAAAPQALGRGSLDAAQQQAGGQERDRGPAPARPPRGRLPARRRRGKAECSDRERHQGHTRDFGQPVGGL